MAGVAPIQPLPPWMSRTYLPAAGGGGSTLVTVQFPQTYSGPNTEGLGWPWTVPGDSAEGTLVSVVDGGQASLIRIGGPTTAASGDDTAAETRATNAVGSQTPPFSSDPSSLALPTGTPTSRPSASISSVDSTPSTLISSQPAGGSIPPSSSSASSASSFRSTSSSASSVMDPSSSTSIQITSSASTSLPTASPTSTTFPASQDPSPSPLPISWRTGISPGVIVAIVIAAIAFLAGLILFPAALFLRRRRRRRSRVNDSWSVISPPEMEERNNPDNSVWSRGIPFSAVPFNSRDRTMSGASQRSQTPADEQEHLIGYRDEGHAGERDSLAELGGIPSSTIEGRPRQASNSTDATQPSSTQSSSTGTRSSLIAQFPTFRKPSDGSGSGSPGAGAGGTSQGGNGAAGGRAGYEGEGPSPGTINSTDLFYSPPARPASGRRTVPTSNPLIGLGRPTDALATTIPAVVGMHKSSATTAPSSGTSSRLLEQNRKDSGSTRTDTTSEPPSLTGKPARPMQTMSDTIPEADVEEGSSPTGDLIDEQGRIVSSNHLHEASLAGWLKGFSFLRPYLGSPSGPRTMHLPSQPEEDALLPYTSKDVEAPEAGPSLVASSAPVARDSPSYRRVTTTAAAYDTQDLLDLVTRNSAARRAVTAQTAAGNESSSEDEEHNQAVSEGRSFLGQSQSGLSQLQASPASPTGTALLKPGARRWSGATLGQPIRRVSNMSSLSLTDLPESIASSIASARQRNKSRSRSRSGSGSQQSSNPLSREHSGSAASLLSMKSSTSRKSGSRRGENSSGGSGSGSGSGHGSLGRGSRRSNKSESSHLHRVSEVFREDRDAPEVPQLPLPSRLT